MLQIRSDALAAAAELSLSTALHCRHVIVSDSESNSEEYQLCKPDSLENSDIELDLQSDDDLSWICIDLGQLGLRVNLAVQNVASPC